MTLYEWENIARQFEKATHYSEKALYNVLVNDIVPVITQELRVRAIAGNFTLAYMSTRNKSGSNNLRRPLYTERGLHVLPLGRVKEKRYEQPLGESKRKMKK